MGAVEVQRGGMLTGTSREPRVGWGWDVGGSGMFSAIAFDFCFPYFESLWTQCCLSLWLWRKQHPSIVDGQGQVQTGASDAHGPFTAN